MTKPKRYKRYSAEFKREAIQRASEEGVTDKAVCDELGISTRQLRRWRDALLLLGADAFRGGGRTRDEEMAGLAPVRSRDSSDATRQRYPPLFPCGLARKLKHLRPEIDKDGHHTGSRTVSGQYAIVLPFPANGWMSSENRV